MKNKLTLEYLNNKIELLEKRINLIYDINNVPTQVYEIALEQWNRAYENTKYNRNEK